MIPVVAAGCFWDYSSDSYSAGYDEGYSYGQEEAYREGYDAGYYDGYEEGRHTGLDIGYEEGLEDSEKADDLASEIEAAYDYAREQTGWSVYEAWNNIGLYHDVYDSNGHPLPTYEEYMQSIETLVYFCEYMDGIDLYR
jgi:hypothetical protein